MKQINTVEDVNQQIFDIILTLPPQEQNNIIKSLKASFVNYRYKVMKEAENNYKQKRELYHDITS